MIEARICTVVMILCSLIAIGWLYSSRHATPAVGALCVKKQGVEATADGKLLACKDELTGKQPS